MSWARFDDGACWHHKILAAGNEAVGAWFRMTVHCCERRTDGFVHRSVALAIAGSEEVLTKLVGAELLEPDEGGFRVHDFLTYNPSAGEAEFAGAQLTEKRSKAGKRGAMARWGASKTQADGKRMASEWQMGRQKMPPIPSEEERDIARTRVMGPRRECDRERLQNTWYTQTGNMGEGLLDVAMLIEDYAALQEPPRNPDDVASEAIKAFLGLIASWNKKPAKIPRKFIEHWGAIQEFMRGERASKPAGDAQGAKRKAVAEMQAKIIERDRLDELRIAEAPR
jgi:hypothetical protein